MAAFNAVCTFMHAREPRFHLPLALVGRVSAELVEAAPVAGNGRVVLGRERARLLTHPRVEAEVQQLDEQLLTIGGLVVQEPRELTLRKHDALREVLERQAEQLLDRRFDVARASRPATRRRRSARAAPPAWWRPVFVRRTTRVAT